MRRDPRTGQFVSDDDHDDWTDTTRIAASMHSSIPAADLGGGVVTEGVEGAEAQIAEFTDILENDEIFHLHSLQISATFAMPTTATAESSGECTWVLTRGSHAYPFFINSPFYNGSVDAEDGIVDITSHSEEESQALAVGQMRAEPSFKDTVNALGAGGQNDADHRTVHFGPRGPAYDRDDELYLVHEFDVDNVSNHAVDASWHCLLHGVIEELD